VLQKADLSTPGRAVLQALVEVPGRFRPGRHTHPGEEVGYVLEGTLVLWVLQCSCLGKSTQPQLSSVCIDEGPMCVGQESIDGVPARIGLAS
jgi:Cupin domain